MESSELGQKMRGAFEAIVPSEDAILRRHGKTVGLGWGEDLPTATRHPRPAKRFGHRTVVASAVLAAAGALLVWVLAEDRAVTVGPSLERDLRTALPQKAETPVVHEAAEKSSPEPARSLPARSQNVERSGERPTGQHGIRAAEGASPSVEADASWARVTEAMRQRDWAAAQTALAPLLASTDVETRDSARLVRVRLTLGAAQEASSETLLELDELAKSGSTSSIRASARRLRETLLADDTMRTDETKQPPSEGELPGVEE